MISRVFRRPLSWIALLATVISTLMSGCSSTLTSTEGPTPTPLPTPVVPTKPTYTVQRGDVVREIEFVGHIAPIVDQTLFFRMSGHVRQLNVTFGSVVTAGQVLADLEMSELQLATAQQTITDTLTEAQIALDTARLRFAQAQTEDVSGTVTIAQINLFRAQRAVTDAEDEYNKSLYRTWELPEAKKPYRDALERARQDLTIAQAQYDQAVANHNAHDYAVQILAQDVKLARLRVNKLERGVDPKIVQAVEMARLTVKRLEDQLADTQLVAPFDGQVTSVGIAAGDAVEAFKPVMVVADLQRLEVSADLTGNADATYLSEGMPVVLEFYYQPGKEPLKGVIRHLPRQTAGGNVEDKDRTTRISLEKPAAEIGVAQDDAMRVKVVLERKDNVLWLPPQAIRTFEGRKFVVVQDGQALRRVDVKVGVTGKDRVEILEGLTEGQVVQAQ
jgi:multidrug efflux pump subunit AcrA (membrane-fusion protein)